MSVEAQVLSALSIQKDTSRHQRGRPRPRTFPQWQRGLQPVRPGPQKDREIVRRSEAQSGNDETQITRSHRGKGRVPADGHGAKPETAGQTRLKATAKTNVSLNNEPKTAITQATKTKTAPASHRGGNKKSAITKSGHRKTP